MKQRYFNYLLICLFNFVGYSQQGTHLNFDGVNDNVLLPATAINNLPQGTIEVWVYPTASVLENQTICAKQSNNENTYAYLSIGGGAKVNYQSTNGSSIQSISTIISNQWTHIAVAFTSTQAKIYINGILDKTVSGSFSLPNDTSVTATTIGAILGDGGGQYFTGSIDEFRIWNTARTIEQINGSMNCELQGNETNLLTYYNFNQGIDQADNSTETTLTDATSNGYDGTLTNFTLNGATSNWLAGSPVTTGSLVPGNASVTSPVTYNQGDTASPLSATTGTNGTGLMWYTTATGGTGSTSAPTPSTASGGTTSYWVSSTNANGCESERVEIIVNVNAEATHLNFDGSNDFVNCGAILPASYTKEAWVYFSNSGLQNNFISGGDADGQHALWAPSTYGNRLSAGHNATWNAVQDPTPLALNTWYHIAVTYDAATTTMNLYKNGVLVSTNSSVPAYTSGNTVRLGAYNNANNLLNGNLEEVRIWNTVRTAEQIAGAMNCELQGTETDLIAYYQFNQGVDQVDNSTETTLTDATSNGYDGTLTNFTLNGSTSNWLAGSPVTTGSTVPGNPTVTTPVTYNQGDTATALSATAGTNGTGLMWYTSAAGGAGSTTAPTPSTATVGSTSYWVSSTNANGCESERVEIVVNVNVPNDECANAISLTVGSSSFNDFPENIDLTGATNSGAPTPTCGNFQGGDVWYTVTVPASGNVVIETDGAGLYDTGIEIYTGNCGTLSLVACDDNNGNGNYSKVLLLGQTPGTVYYVRVWENFWGNSNAQFQISAYDYVNPATHLNFDGSNDYVNCGTTNLPTGTSPRTIEAWIKTTQTTGSQSIINYGNQTIGNSRFGFINASGNLYFVGEGNDYNTNTLIADGNWHHIAATYEASILKIYIDGALNATVTKVLNTNNNIFNIGASCNPTPGEFFNGSIDEVRVWNIALTEADILATMNCEAQSQPELVAYYKFNQGFDAADNTSVTTLTDEMGTNNGTLTNFALTGAISNWAEGSSVTTGNTCVTLSNTDFDSVSGKTLKVFPNPTNGIVSIRSNVNLTIEIYDLLGKIILTKKINSGVEDINITNYPSGIYLVKSTNEEGISKMYKIIKK